MTREEIEASFRRWSTRAVQLDGQLIDVDATVFQHPAFGPFCGELEKRHDYGFPALLTRWVWCRVGWELHEMSVATTQPILPGVVLDQEPGRPAR